MTDAPKTVPEKKRAPLTHFKFMVDMQDTEIVVTDEETGEGEERPVGDVYSRLVILPVVNTAFIFDKHGKCSATLIGFGGSSKITTGSRIETISAEEAAAIVKKVM